MCFFKRLRAGTHQADGRASLFGVFHSSGLVGAVGERENSDWMFSLANETVPEN